MVQDGYWGFSCQEKEQEGCGSFEGTCQKPPTTLPVTFVEQNLVLWPHLAAREAGKHTSLREE